MSLDNFNSIQQAIDAAYAEISEKFGVDKTEITKVATKVLGATKQRGISARDVQMMFKAGFTTNEIATHLNCTTATVHLKLKQDGLAVRQIRGMSVYDIFTHLPEEKRDAFLTYAAYGDRSGTPLAPLLAQCFVGWLDDSQDAITDTHAVLAYKDDPVFTAEELEAWAGESDNEEEEGEESVEEEEVVEKVKQPTRSRRKRNVFEEETE